MPNHDPQQVKEEKAECECYKNFKNCLQCIYDNHDEHCSPEPEELE